MSEIGTPEGSNEEEISCTLVAAALTLFALASWSKTQTIKLEIVGPGLSKPLEITDREIVDRFNIWNGPGVRVDGKPLRIEPQDLEEMGAFADWSRKPAPQPPAGMPRYTVTFHQAGREPMHDWHRSYVIMYAFDPITSS
ncbi:MAG: hypothetical protein ABW034_26345 [Steroidobacteraceae bacterium]